MTAEATWYKDAIIYELHVRAFCDADGNGIGDLNGLTERLEYLQDLGVTAVWLLPFYPSPLRDDGYDIADYTDVHPDYGTLPQFKVFLREAHRRGLRVITELVLNHTSDRHAWFRAARHAPPGSAKRNFYVWSDSPERYRDVRVIFKDFEASNWSWDPVARAYYWHRFYAHQPDLNFDHPEVERALFRIVDFWLNLGVDGLRLDAVPYLYEREGTSCENLPETHAFLKRLRRHVDTRYQDRMLLAEANQWPEDAIAYFGDGDESHMNYHFPLMPRMFMALSMEDRFPIIDILQQTPEIPAACQWAVFLRNHDELTLEMVTDEERDYMYRAYAHELQMRINLGIRRRLAPLLGNSRRKIELMNGLLFSLPGTPVLYYGDEIGMGDNVFLGDRSGVRTPLQWSPDRNAGFSRANPQRLYLPVIIDPEYHYEAVNIETQRANPQSLFWWMKRLISIRKHFKAFGRGSMELLHPANPQVLAFYRRYEDECILVLANLSRFAQFVELDLSQFVGATPVEVFGQTPFPRITDRPYPITIAPHTFFWFALRLSPAAETAFPVRPDETEQLTVAGSWEQLCTGNLVVLERLLTKHVQKRSWFPAAPRGIRESRVIDAIPLASGVDRVYLCLVRVQFIGGATETYAVPVGFVSDGRKEEWLDGARHSIVASLVVDEKSGTRQGLLVDVSEHGEFTRAVISTLRRPRSIKGSRGVLHTLTTPARRDCLPNSDVDNALLDAGPRSTAMAAGNRLVIKLYRLVQAGLTPGLELSRYLMNRTDVCPTPRLVGALTYQSDNGAPQTVCTCHEFVTNEGDAWRLTLRHLKGFYENALAAPEGSLADLTTAATHLAKCAEPIPDSAERLIGLYLESAKLLGLRTAQLHLALSSTPDDPDMAAEPMTPFYRRSLYQTMRNQAADLLRNLKSREFPDGYEQWGAFILRHETDLMRRLQRVKSGTSAGRRIRCHGDFQLPKVLYTGQDFVIIDFDGEPGRPISERRIKRPALHDVAGMLRSLHAAADTALTDLSGFIVLNENDYAKMKEAARFWYAWVSAAFLNAYLERVRESDLVPKSTEDIEAQLDSLLLEKAMNDIHHELAHRPERAGAPLRGLCDLLAMNPTTT